MTSSHVTDPLPQSQGNIPPHPAEIRVIQEPGKRTKGVIRGAPHYGVFEGLRKPPKRQKRAEVLYKKVLKCSVRSGFLPWVVIRQ